MIKINQMLNENIHSLGAAAYKKFLASELIQNWAELVDVSISD